VTNNSHADPDEHSYLVNVEGGAPVVCDCPAFRHQDGPCKHLVAVAIREPVLQAAQDDQSTAMNGGGAIVKDDQNGDQSLCNHPDCQYGMDVDRPILCWEHWEMSQP
jgi:hypothetical protein